MPQTLQKGTQKRHIRKNNKYTKKRQTEMLGGGFFSWLISPETKLGFILADHAMSCNYVVQGADTFDDKTKLLLLKVFRNLFKNFLKSYKGTEIKSGGNSETIQNLLKSIKFKTSGDGKYEIEKYENNAQNDTYLKKIKEYICKFISFLTNNKASNYINQDYYNDNYKLQEPIPNKKSTDKYSTTKFFGGQDVGAVEVINILYKLNFPDVPASETNKKKYRTKMRHQIADEFNNNISQYAQAFNTYLSFQKSKSL